MAMGLFVPLNKEMKAQLLAIARRERRRPQDQAALIIENFLKGLFLTENEISYTVQDAKDSKGSTEFSR